MKTAATLILFFFSAISSAAAPVLERSVKVPSLTGAGFRQFTFNNSRGAIAYRTETGTFLMRGHPSFPDWAEIDVTGETAVVKGWSDPTHGLAAALTAATPGTQGFYLRGLHILPDDQTFGAISQFYNTAATNRAPFFRGDLSLGGPAAGPWNGGQHSLQLGGYLSPLSPELRRFYRVRWGGGETSAQGTSSSNRGPSLYVFEMPERSFLSNGVFQSTAIISYTGGAAYPEYYPSWKINSLHCLPDRVIWTGRRGDGANWYGNGTGFAMPDGTIVNDPAYPGDKGYHSERYIPTVWECSNASIMAGVPVITETTLPGMTAGKGSDITSAWDGIRLHVVDPKSDADRPLIRIFRLE